LDSSYTSSNRTGELHRRRRPLENKPRLLRGGGAVGISPLVFYQLGLVQRRGIVCLSRIKNPTEKKANEQTKHKPEIKYNNKILQYKTVNYIIEE